MANSCLQVKRSWAGRGWMFAEGADGVEGYVPTASVDFDSDRPCGLFELAGEMTGKTAEACLLLMQEAVEPKRKYRFDASLKQNVKDKGCMIPPSPPLPSSPLLDAMCRQM